MQVLHDSAILRLAGLSEVFQRVSKVKNYIQNHDKKNSFWQVLK